MKPKRGVKLKSAWANKAAGKRETETEAGLGQLQLGMGMGMATAAK